MEIKLQIPQSKVKEDVKIRNVILFGLPKIGKTTACSIDSSIVFSFENTNPFIESYKIDLSEYMKSGSPDTYNEILKQMVEVCNQLKGNDKFKYIVIDSLSSMLPLAKHIGEVLYSRTAIGKNWFSELKPKYGDLLNLPKGLGYDFMKKGFEKIKDIFNSTNKTCIWIGHIKDKYVDTDVSQVGYSEVDIPGSISRMFSKDAEIVGYLYKKTDKYLIVSFKNNSNVLCGTNVPYLSNKEFILSELKGDTVVSYLDELLTFQLKPVDTTTLTA